MYTSRQTFMKGFTLLAAMLVAGVLASHPALAKDKLTDAQISSAIDAELLQDTAVNSNAIDVSVQEGIATLTGSVDNILAKDRAIRLAEAIRGVRSIVDKISVAAPQRPDAELRKDIENALLYDPATESYEVTVSVTDQKVTLNGTVDSWQEQELAAKVTKGVRGVKEVENKINVVYKSTRPDSEIKADIQKALRWDVLVDDALIDVTVNDGEVTLSGTVGSAAEKREARYDALVAGVKAVNDDKLNVARWARDADLRKDKYVSKTDEAIKDAVNDAMLYDPRVNSFKISVSADAGVVTLTGVVDNLKAKRAAAQDARATVGVWRVKNHVKVRPLDMADDTIESNIESALLRDPDINRFDITVSVINGNAYLAGSVDSNWEKAVAEGIASRAAGVVQVHNNLVVDNTYSIMTYDPYVDFDYYYDYDWFVGNDYEVTPRSDWEIHDDIRDELFWSPFVESDEVTVTVNNGVATLTGTVGTWSERQSATENALEGGAVAVDNDLLVSYGPAFYNGD